MGYISKNGQKKDIEEIVMALNSVQHRIDKVILFGSCARKTNKKDSDIDICIISNIDNFELMTKDTVAIMDYAEELGFDSELDIVDYRSLSELKEASKDKNNIAWHILKDGETIYERR